MWTVRRCGPASAWAPPPPTWTGSSRRCHGWPRAARRWSTPWWTDATRRSTTRGNPSPRTEKGPSESESPMALPLDRLHLQSQQARVVVRGLVVELGVDVHHVQRRLLGEVLRGEDLVQHLGVAAVHVAVALRLV